MLHYPSSCLSETDRWWWSGLRGVAWGGRCEAAGPNDSNGRQLTTESTNGEKRKERERKTQFDPVHAVTPSGRAAPARQAPIGRCKTAGCMCEASYTAGFFAAALRGGGGGDRWLDLGGLRPPDPVEGVAGGPLAVSIYIRTDINLPCLHV